MKTRRFVWKQQIWVSNREKKCKFIVFVPEMFLINSKYKSSRCLSYFASFFILSVCQRIKSWKSTHVTAKAEAPKNKSVSVLIASNFIPQGWITRHIERVKFTSPTQQHQMKNIKNPKQKITCCWCFMELLLRRRQNFPSFLPAPVHKLLRERGRAPTTSPNDSIQLRWTLH